MKRSEARPQPGSAVLARDIELAPIHVVDIVGIVRRGAADFLAAPLTSIAVAAVYTLGGWLLAALLLVLRLPFLVYPLAMGFALIAPFMAVAFYDVSRRREAGEDASFTTCCRAAWRATGREIRWMALITSFAFFLWMDIAAMLTLSFFGAAALDMRILLREIFSSSSGWAFLVIGHAVGAVIALLVFSISVLSIPMLFDREIDILTAIRTSVRLVRQNPIALGLWCAFIALSIVVSIATGLLALPVVLPVLGYASWHLYRRAVPLA